MPAPSEDVNERGLPVEGPPPRPLSIPQDDAEACIAQAYDLHLQRPASPPEVQSWVERLREGVGLARVLEAIATSPAAMAVKAQHLDRGEDRDSFLRLLRLLYRHLLGRLPVDDEIELWFNSFGAVPSYPAIAEAISSSPEADSFDRLVEEPDGVFVQCAVEIVLRRGATPAEIERIRRLLASQALSRTVLLRAFFAEAVRDRRAPAPSGNDTATARLHGRAEPVTSADWTAARAAAAKADPSPRHARFPFHPPASGPSPRPPLVSIVTSLFRGGRYLDAFLDNIASQSIFEHCELIIVDAASDQGEAERIRTFAQDRGNIVYVRCAERIGIYAAWNMAVRAARGVYLTNANLDDCRRWDSLEVQAAALDALPFVDVVYQDVLYSFEANLPFEAIEAAGFRTDLPSFSANALMAFNLPHNAPMWRRRLHDEIGYFDESYESAGDYDFWLRCAAEGKSFYKLEDAHVGYFYNPDGVSTRSDTRGGREARLIGLERYRGLVAEEFLEPIDAFRARLADAIAPIGQDGGQDAGQDAGPDGNPDGGGDEDRHALVAAALLAVARRHRGGGSAR